jgi:hypothetical protein
MNNLVLMIFLIFAILVAIQVFFTVAINSSLRSPSAKLLSDTQFYPKWQLFYVCVALIHPDQTACDRFYSKITLNTTLILLLIVTQIRLGKLSAKYSSSNQPKISKSVYCKLCGNTCSLKCRLF